MSDRTVGLTGRARSGKSTVAEILRRDHGFTVISFADHLEQDSWVDAWSVKVGRAGDISDADVVAADVRFANEAEAVIHRFGGEVWRIERPDLIDPSGAAGHVSEAGIPDRLVNLTIVNDGTLEDLANAVADAISQHPPIGSAA